MKQIYVKPGIKALDLGAKGLCEVSPQNLNGLGGENIEKHGDFNWN